MLGGRLVMWNNSNHSCITFNINGSCLSLPVRAGYGEVIRNSVDYYLSGFSSYIQWSTNILHVKLFVIYQGLLST